MTALLLQAAAGGLDATPIVVATVAGMLGAIPGFLAWRASTKANDLSSRKVDQEAYDRAVVFYQRQLDDANKQLDRVRTQVDSLHDQLAKVNSQLATEQESSSVLRTQLRSLQSTVDVLNATIIDLKARLAARITDS